MRRKYWAATLAAFVLAMPMVSLADDQEVADQIKQSLTNSGRMKNYAVGVTVKDGTAWLNGTVASEEQKATARMIAEDVYGVDRVVDKLTISQGKATAQRGSRPGQRSTRLLQPESVAAAVPTDGEAENGVVRASMELPSHAQEELAIAGPPQPMRDDVPMASQPNERLPMAQPAPQQMPMAQPQPMAMSQNEQQAYLMAARQAQPMQQAGNRKPMPLPMGARGPYPQQQYQQVSRQVPGGEMIGTPQPMPMQGTPLGGASPAPMHYDNPSMPGYAWPSYAAHPNYAAVSYPKQYSPTAWPYIGPFYPYPQVPLGWRKVTLEWDDGWWMLDFKDSH